MATKLETILNAIRDQIASTLQHQNTILRRFAEDAQEDPGYAIEWGTQRATKALLIKRYTTYIGAYVGDYLDPYSPQHRPGITEIQAYTDALYQVIQQLNHLVTDDKIWYSQSSCAITNAVRMYQGRAALDLMRDLTWMHHSLIEAVRE